MPIRDNDLWRQHLVAYLSQLMSLHPVTLFRQAPPSVGMGMKPPRFLKHGDVVELGIEGLGASGSFSRIAGKVG